MNNSPDFFKFSAEQLCSQLSAAFQEVSRSPDKCVYQTNRGIRALSQTEVRTYLSAERINFTNHTEALASIMRGLNVQPSGNNLEEISQKFAIIMQKPHIASITEFISKGRDEGKEKAVLDSGRLKYTAEVEGFGYKKANLDQVSELCKEEFGAFSVKVPVYAGISSNDVQRLLKRKGGLNVVKRWKDIVKKHFPSDRPEIKAEVMRAKKFSPEFYTDCVLLRQDIKDAFALLTLRIEEEGGVDALFDVNNTAAVIAEVQKQNERLSVRSTGKEDTVELANAGGNTSVSNVIPTSENILGAISEVVISYFGEKSLKQRLGANDLSIFEPNPLTPVVIQRMIGEKTPKAMPLCGVMLTEDPESRLANAHFDTESSGNSIFQVAYGHNEAVVNGLIPVDTYYVNNEGTLFPIIRPKTHRMVPTEKNGELRLEDNSPEKTFTATLTKPAIGTLKAFSRRIEEFYGRAMDIEFVIEGDTIYIVQARPIVHNKSAAASYIPDLKRLGDGQILKGSAIGAAGGGIRLVQSREVITASTMSEALDKYQECEDPGSIKAIVVEKMAPSTSHWATIFRNEGKPVLYIKEINILESWLEDPEAHLIISPQQGIVAHLGATAPTFEELQANGTCVNGWVDYPAPMLFSNCPQFQSAELLTDEFIHDICPVLRDPTKWAKFQKHAGKIKLQEVFDALATVQGDKLHMSLAMLLFAFKHTLEQRLRGFPSDADQQHRTNALQSQALTLARSIKANGEFSPNHAHFGRKLLPIHFLKALVYAQPHADEVVYGDSLARDIREIQAEHILAKELHKEGIILTNPYSLSLLSLTRFAIIPEIAKCYRDYVISLDHLGHGALLQDLATLLNGLNKLDMLVSWLNIVLPRNPDIRLYLETFQKLTPLFNTLAEKRQKLKALNVSAFSIKKSFHNQWKILKSELLDYVTSDVFAEKYKHADVSGKFAMHALMYQVVDQLDLSIKALEGSSKTEFSNNEKLELFQDMLKEYHRFANSWLMNFDFSPAMKKNISVRLKNISPAIFKSGLSTSDLRFSKYFDLAAFGSQSGASQSRVAPPESLEDGFSALHRELLTMLNLLFQDVSDIPIPMLPMLQKVTQELFMEKASVIELSARGVTACYIRKLREHGVQYRINQLFGSEKLTLSVRFSAKNEGDRWDNIAHFMLLLKVYGKFDITDLELGSKGVGYTFNLDEYDNIEVLRKILLSIENYSSDAPFGANAPDISAVINDNKLLKPWTDDRRIIQEFERICGMGSMLTNQNLIYHLKRAFRKEPSFGEVFLKRAWLNKLLNYVGRYHTNETLPIILLETGNAIGPITLRAIHLLNSDENTAGISLLLALSNQNPQALPMACEWQLLRILGDKWQSESHVRVKMLLERFQAKGLPTESIQENLLLALYSPKKSRRSEGIKVLDLVLTRYPHYLTSTFKDALNKAAADSSLDDATRFNLLKRL